jgi:hypothetical protein
MIFGAIETVVCILAHRALKDLPFFPVHLLPNDVAKSGANSRIGIDEIHDFSNVWLSRDLHIATLYGRCFDCSTAHFGCVAPPRFRTLSLQVRQIPNLVRQMTTSFFRPVESFRNHDS